MKQSGNQILDNLRYATERLTVINKAGEANVGTGFFFVTRLDEKTSYPLLVTNKHMICDGDGNENWMSLSFNVNKAGVNGEPIFGETVTITFKNTPDQFRLVHPDADLCAFPIWSVIDSYEKQGVTLCYRYFPEELIPDKNDFAIISSIEEILMVGYPDGVSDEVHNLPIVRRGITATDYKIDYNGRKEFLIDASIFKGSSGSPIVICNIGSYNDAEGQLCLGNRVLFLGIQYRGEFSKYQNNIYIRDNNGVFRNTPDVLSTYFNDLGFCVKSECLLYFKEEIKRQARK